MPVSVEPDTERAPFRPVTFGPMEVEVVTRPDGCQIVRHLTPLGAYPQSIPHILAERAAQHPERVFLAERDTTGAWKTLTFGAAKARADAVAQALLDRGLGKDRPLMILSGNSIEFGVLVLAAMTARVPVAPVSPAYSLLSKDFANLKHVFGLVEPALIFTQTGKKFSRALDVLDLSGVEVVCAQDPVRASTLFSDLLKVKVGPGVAASLDAITGDTVAKYLFTSGSTGPPKGVINTQRMMCANVVMYRIVRPRRADDEPDIAVDWLPWHHTFAGNGNFNMSLDRGTTIYIDKGRPVPGQFEETIRNLREVSPTTYASVPAAFSMLAQAMETDDALRESFFRRLTSMLFGGAAISDDVYDRIQALAVRTTGHRVVFVAGYGATETAPSMSGTYWLIEGASGQLGLPMPEVEFKLVPDGDRYEIRCKGPNVTPGFLKRPDLTNEAFDEDGFYRIGDAARWVDPADPQQGLAFAGRVAENFKLVTGTWVQTGTLRVAVLAATSPLLHDAVVAGQDRDYVGLLAWPNIAAMKRLCGGVDDIAPEELVRRPEVVSHIRDGLAAYNAANPGSSSRISRVLLMLDPPDPDEGEITDKGYISQRRALERRAGRVGALYADPPADGVIVI